MYERVGTYDGKVPLQELASRLDGFTVAWTTAPGNYGTTVEHLGSIRDAFSDVAEFIPGAWPYSMLTVLPPDGFIPFHSDVPSGSGLERFHLVLSTNERCWNFHEGSWQQLELGGIYSMDMRGEHASLNWGDTPRVHLVVDVVTQGAPIR